jgi:hypothetical protein
MLLRLGHRIPREQLCQSLVRVDPVQRVFERIHIRRHVYSVPGPNALWHHDGQHGKKIVMVLDYKYFMLNCPQALFTGELSFMALLMATPD